MSTHAHVVNVMRSVAFLQRMIYRPPSQSCHRRRLESSAVIPSILWMGTGVPCLLVNRETPAWNWLLKCHICHKAKKVIAQDTEEGCDFLLFLPWSQKIHADLFPFIYPCIFMFIPPGTFPPVHMLGFSSTLLLIHWVTYIHTQELCSTISFLLLATEQLYKSRWWVSAF